MSGGFPLPGMGTGHRDGASEEASVECAGGCARQHSVDAASILLTQQHRGQVGMSSPAEAREAIAQGHAELVCKGYERRWSLPSGDFPGDTGSHTVNCALQPRVGSQLVPGSSPSLTKGS